MSQALYCTCLMTLMTLCLGLTACSEQVHLVGHKFSDSADAGGETDGGKPAEPWGAWAARLDLPDCPPGKELTVDTAADELEGGPSITERAQAGERLSLNEALWIAHNHAGPETIRFDAQMFPAGAPTTIVIHGDFELPLAPLQQVCIDGRNRGVVVHWAHSARTGVEAHDAAFVWGIGNDSAQMGLELRALEFGQKLTTGGLIAGCRYFSEDGDFEHTVTALVSIGGGTLGPGNLFDSTRIAGVAGSDGWVKGNYLGFDPRSGSNDRPLGTGMFLGGSPVVEENVISAIHGALDFFGQNLTFRNNWVAIEPRTLAPLVGSPTAIDLGLGAESATIGPGNHIRAYLIGIELGTLSTVATVTQSTFIAPTPIFIADPQAVPGFEPPVIVSADVGSVSGTCRVPGLVEVFSGASGSPELFLGEAQCPTAGPWTAAVATVSGTQLTATSTALDGRTTAFSKPFRVP